MQFVTHRDPVNVGGWSTALGATGDAINNLLGIYAGYKNQQLEEKRRQQQMAMEQQRIDIERERQQRILDQEDIQNRLLGRENELRAIDQGLEGERPQAQIGTIDVRQRDLTGQGLVEAPGMSTEANKAEAAKATPLVASPTKTVQMQTFTEAPPVEKRTLGEIRDARGNLLAPEITRDVLYRPEVIARNSAALLEKEIAEGRQVRLTQEERAQLAESLNPRLRAMATRETVPASAYDDLYKSTSSGGSTDKIFDKATGKYYSKNQETGKYDVLVGQVTPEPEKKEKDPFELPAGVALVVPRDINSIPPALRAQVKAIAEGRQAPPALGNRPGSPGFHLMAYVNAYDPDASFEAVQARWKAHGELTRGGPTSRGGQMTNLNTFADHLNVLQDKADELNNKLANSDWQSINWLDQKLTRSGKKGPIAAYDEAAKTFVTEYIKTLKGASPTDQENREFAKIKDPTLAPAERQAAIDTLKQFVESRANEQETWYTQQFGRSSAEERDAGIRGRPFLGESWTWDGSRWTIPRRTQGQKSTTGVAPSAGGAQTTNKEQDWYRDANGNLIRRK